MRNIDLLCLNVTSEFKILGTHAFDPACTSVKDAGDINGDGVNDFIIEAPWENPSGRSYAGTAYVIYCKAASIADLDLLNLTPDQGFKILGSVSSD